MRTNDLVKSYLKGEKLNIEIDKDLKNELIAQSLQTILYPVCNKGKNYYISWVQKQEEFYNLEKEITNLFNQNKIPHVYFKGTVLSKIYDDKYIRTRGDIDLYVMPKDLNRAVDILKSNGYINEDNEDCMHHIGLTKNGLNVEVHFSMFDGDENKKWIEMFKEPFNVCEIDYEYRYKFMDTYHFVYCLMHFAKHLRHGAGIRYILDFYYMFLKYKLDFNLLHKLLHVACLDRLYNNILNLLYDLTDNKYDKFEEEDISFFTEYLLSYGIHGNHENDTDIASAHTNKMKYFFDRVFLTNKAYRISLYPKMGRKAILYPLCVICHLFYLLTHKLKRFFVFMFGKNKNKALYKKLGV